MTVAARIAPLIFAIALSASCSDEGSGAESNDAAAEAGATDAGDGDAGDADAPLDDTSDVESSDSEQPDATEVDASEVDADAHEEDGGDGHDVADTSSPVEDAPADAPADTDIDAGWDPGAPPSPCAEHHASCGGVCRAVEVDPSACGACDVVCVAGEVCEHGVCTDPAPPAPECDAEKVAEVLAAATSDAAFVNLDCSLTLPPGSVVDKAIRLTGSEASGVVLDCQGGTIRRGVPEGGADLVLIESRKVDGGWDRPTDATIRDCRIEGAVRVRGQGSNGQAPDVTTDSWTPGHRERAQAAAPTRVLLEELTIVGDGRIPLYLAPGVTQLEFRDSEIVGESVSTVMYLDAESAYNRIVGNRFAAATRLFLPREELAVDGSADNLIAGNVFEGVVGGGIFVYRNCGEGGAVRHQEPRRNVIAGNVFVLEGAGWENPWLWVGSRNEGGLHTITYCDLDDDYAFGSGASNRDYARDTVVVGNRFVESPERPAVSGAWGFEVDDGPTYAEDNHEVAAAGAPLGAVCAVFFDEAPPELLRDGQTAADGRLCTDGRLE